MSGLFIGDSPVDGRNLPAQWHRAVATISINGESPAYSHGGDQSAGFYGYGIQQATRLKRAHANSRKRDNTYSSGGVKRSGANPRKMGKSSKFRLSWLEFQH